LRIAVVSSVLLPTVAWAQKAADKPKPAKPPAEELAGAFEFMGKELVDMAEDFPEAKYDYKPTPEVRTFAEQLLHAAGADMMFRDMIEGRKPSMEDLARTKYKTKADVVKVLKQAIADDAASIRKAGEPGLNKTLAMPFGPPHMVTARTMWGIAMGHMAEHYGQLVIYYRLNKMVPPQSRPQK
jgi:hypothetical protein